MSKYFLALDVGGTKIKALVLDHEFTPLAGLRAPTGRLESMDELMDRVFAAADEVLTRAGATSAELLGIGMGCFGLIDSDRGRGIMTLRLDFRDYEIAARLTARYGVPAKIDNDAHVAVLGEQYLGAAVGHRDIVQLTIGTALAAGVVVDGSVLRGRSDVACEIGHFVVQTEGGRPCFCGRSGCALKYVSGTALHQALLEAMDEHPESIVWDLARGEKSAVDLSMLSPALEAGDPAGHRALESLLSYLVPLTSSLMMMFNPSILVVGGGVSALGERLVGPLRERASAEVLDPAQVSLVERAHLGQESGLFGAAVRIAQHVGVAMEPHHDDTLAARVTSVMAGATA